MRFEFNEPSQPGSQHTQKSGLTDAIAFVEPKTIFEDDYVVLDSKKVPQNTIESIERRMIKLNRRFKKTYPTQGDFDKKLRETVAADANGNVTVDQLRDFVLGLVEDDMVNQRVAKRDVEGFLSAFGYNAYGATNIDGISQLVYSRDDDIPNKLALRQRANPPPVEVNKDFPSSKDIKTEECHNDRIKGILAEIEEKVFQGKTKMYHLFKKFDTDNDGFVSHQDFDSYVKSIKVDASKKEITQIMKLLDEKNKGYLTFNDFSKTFTPSMS